jgi:hypothetical protein
MMMNGMLGCGFAGLAIAEGGAMITTATINPAQTTRCLAKLTRMRKVLLDKCQVSFPFGDFKLAHVPA